MPEAAALLREARYQEDDLDAAASRLAAGERLLNDLWPNRDPGGDRIVLDGSKVVESTVGGRAVVRDGCLQTADLGEIQAQAREQSQRLWRRMESL